MVEHCGLGQSGEAFFCLVICEMVEKENVADVRHLMERHNGAKPQSNTIHQHVSYKTAADKTILVPAYQQLEFKGFQIPELYSQA